MVESVPLRFDCQTCGHRLLTCSFIFDQVEDAVHYELIVTSLDLICPTCNGHARRAEDDFTRAVAQIINPLGDS